MNKTDPLPEVQEFWQQELHVLLKERQDMEAVTEHRMPIVRVQMPATAPDVTEEETVRLPRATDRALLEMTQGTSPAKQRDSSGSLPIPPAVSPSPIKRIYIPAPTPLMRVMHNIKTRIESLKHINKYSIPKVVHLSEEDFKETKWWDCYWWYDPYYRQWYKVPIADDRTLPRSLKKDEVMCEHW